MPAPLKLDVSYSATEVNKAGAQVYDDAWAKGAVEITRRGQRFVLLRQDYLAKLIEEARDDSPQSLDEMLKDYDPDKIKTLTQTFMAAPLAGKEVI